MRRRLRCVGVMLSNEAMSFRVAEPRVGRHHLGYGGSRETVNVAGDGGDYRATRPLAVDATGKVADKVSGKFEANDMFDAV